SVLQVPSLAIHGGPMAVTLDQTEANRWPILTAEDEAAVIDVIRDGDLSYHKVTRELESDYRRRIGRKHAIATANGTLALLAAFHALNLAPRDEVLVPSATFWASVLPMLWVGAVPVFCNVEGERFGLDPIDVERRITERTRAMVVVHLWGLPAKMTQLRDVARRYDLRIVEDASHALGAVSRGVPCGAFGDIAVFSLQSSKLAPAGEGGIFLTDSDDYWKRATCLGDIARISELRSTEHRFAATSFGIKTRISPLSSAIGRVQLRHLDKRNEQRRMNIERLNVRLEELGIETFPGPSHLDRVYHANMVRYQPGRFGDLPLTDLLAALAAEGCVLSELRYPFLHQQPFFTEGHWKAVARLAAGNCASMVNSDDLSGSVRCLGNIMRLPTFPSATPALLEQYAHAFEKVQTWAINRGGEVS
ncbi:MAG: perosamine synthetase, partial [Thermoanaerobaculia bacterium]|nr:perosamine synthetase [Thermoanaerobaculia bacterium]